MRLIAIAFCIAIYTQLPAQPQPYSVETKTIPGTEVSYQLAYLPGGAFRMGEGEGHEVSLDPFWIGVKEVTYEEFVLFQYRDNDSDASVRTEGQYKADAVLRPTPQYIDFTFGMGSKGGFPAVSMTQQGALRYCQWLYQKTGEFYRLPTEAEWEYACRAGATGSLPPNVSADSLQDHAWLFENSYEKYQPTGQKTANAWGLYDLLGNVAEWTLDQYADNYFELIGAAAANPLIPPTQRHSRTVRGGSYDTFAQDCSCTRRQKSDPRWQQRDPQIPKSKWWNTDSPFLGFRLVKPAKAPTAAEVEAFFQGMIRD